MLRFFPLISLTPNNKTKNLLHLPLQKRFLLIKTLCRIQTKKMPKFLITLFRLLLQGLSKFINPYSQARTKKQQTILDRHNYKKNTTNQYNNRQYHQGTKNYTHKKLIGHILKINRPRKKNQKLLQK